ncbi:MAG: ATP-binding cassette domain-containing protein [Spirochaetales bacterium]|jgi:zinc transport system ATP-binding protein|nr:ATP-binding cassette domain-containing protein [Spirochaetales bacterium]
MSIELEGVSFRYRDKLIIDAVTCTIFQGEFISMIGPNGGGKTTLLKLILGLLRPEAGKISIDGAPVQNQRQRIGYVPQTTSHDAKFPISVEDVVKTGLLTQHPFMRSKMTQKKCLDALDVVDLADFASQPFFALSGGQKQRVLIARALADSPDYLFLDEPTSNVDTVINEQLHKLLKRLSGKRTILLVTHDYALVSSLSSRVFCINKHLHEHPAESVKQADETKIYGDRVARVRHDIVLNQDSCFCEDHSRSRP